MKKLLSLLLGLLAVNSLTFAAPGDKNNNSSGTGIPAPDVLGYSVAYRPSDSLHAATGWRSDSLGNPSAKVWMWTRPQTIREFTIPGWRYNTDSSLAFTSDNHLVIAGFERAGGSTPIRLTEMSLDNPLQAVSDFNIGDDDSRVPMTVTTASGATAVFLYQMTVPNVNFLVYYRNAAGNWSQQQFSFFDQFNCCLPSAMLSCSLQADGTIWVFVSRDGSGMFGLARFAETSGGFNAIDYQENYFSGWFVDGHPVDGDMAPGDELPSIFSISDLAHGRILLAYPKAFAEPYCGPFGSGSYEPIDVVAVYPDKRKALLGMTTGKVNSHTGFGLLSLSGDYIRYLIPALTHDCVFDWQTGLIAPDGTLQTGKQTRIDPPQLTMSVDGNIIFNWAGELRVGTVDLLTRRQ